MRADGQFFSDISRRSEALKAKSAHPADWRRLLADLRGWASKFSAKTDWGAEIDQPALEGVYAWIDVIDAEIENRVVAGSFMRGSLAPASGWINSDTGEAIKNYDAHQNIADDAPQSGNVTVGDIVAGMLMGAKRQDVKASGAPKGNRNARKHGGRSAETLALMARQRGQIG